MKIHPASGSIQGGIFGEKSISGDSHVGQIFQLDSHLGSDIGSAGTMDLAQSQRAMEAKEERHWIFTALLR